MATVDVFTTPYAPTIVVPYSRMTLEDFRNWAYSEDFPKQGRVSYIRGNVIVEMSPESIDTQNRVKREINAVIDEIVRTNDLGDYYPDGLWITHRDAGVSNEPDAAFASWETLASGKLAPAKDRNQDWSGIELVGTPDWVCEIVSDSSVKKDTEWLLSAYHKAGVPEYWLIDARGEEIDFRLLVWTPDGYQAAVTDEGWAASPVFGGEFRLTRSRDRLGRWAYELARRQG